MSRSVADLEEAEEAGHVVMGDVLRQGDLHEQLVTRM
jgi:hypothetical protein